MVFRGCVWALPRALRSVAVTPRSASRGLLARASLVPSRSARYAQSESGGVLLHARPPSEGGALVPCARDGTGLASQLPIAASTGICPTQHKVSLKALSHVPLPRTSFVVKSSVDLMIEGPVFTSGEGQNWVFIH